MNHKEIKRILLIMPPFWDPICPPQGIVSLKAYLDTKGYTVYISDLNLDSNIFNLQRRYFELIISYLPHWRYLNIYRNGPRYFARHQLIWFYACNHGERYKELIRHVLNIDGKSILTNAMIDALDIIIKEGFESVLSKTEDLIISTNPDVVGCTMLESTLPLALAILKYTKETNPGIITLLGGPGPVTGTTIDDGNLERITERCEWIDAIIFGEGEELLEGYLNGSLNDRKILTFKDLNRSGSVKDSLLDINTLPPPDYTGLNVSRYLWLSMFTSRGCPYRCAFCFENLYWGNFRRKEIEKIIIEMETLSKVYKKSRFYLCDSLINHIATRLSETLIPRGYHFQWDSYVRITNECLDKETVGLWAKAGMERARLGIESGSPNVLRLMNKGINTAQITEALRNLSEKGIQTTTLWISGFPGERDADFQDTLRFLSENHRFIYQADIWEFISVPRRLTSHDISDRNFLTRPLYPAEFDDLLLLIYYDQEVDNLSPERFEKIRRFEELRIKLGIPNPYSIMELLLAQKRWADLGHANARAAAQTASM